MRKTTYRSSLLKVVIRGCEVLKHHQLKSKRTIFLHGLWRALLFMQNLECLIIYAKPRLAEDWPLEEKHHSSLLLTLSCKCITKSTAVYQFLIEIFAKFWLMWFTEHEEKWIFEVANTKEVRSVFTQLYLCQGVKQNCRGRSVPARKRHYKRLCAGYFTVNYSQLKVSVHSEHPMGSLQRVAGVL